MSFLKAEWKKLAIANYIIDETLLQKYLPRGTELDLWNGNCFVSLVGFMFKNTKLLGFKIPFHTDFEEVNLRFYVKRLENGQWKRGVVFIKEIVPKKALTLVANVVYNENYETMQMKHNWRIENDNQIVEYNWKHHLGWNSLKVVASLDKFKIESNSVTEFITEHYWGYTKANNIKTYEYEVTHPKWEVYKVNNYDIDVNFKLVYGDDFEILNNRRPNSVMLAEGSHITVENKRTIKTH